MFTLPPTPVSKLLRAEKLATANWESTAATAMAPSALAGGVTKPKFPAERSALLPAAAMTNVPALSARRMGTSYCWIFWLMFAPSDMDTILQPLVKAHSMPATMPLVEPDP